MKRKIFTYLGLINILLFISSVYVNTLQAQNLQIVGPTTVPYGSIVKYHLIDTETGESPEQGQLCQWSVNDPFDPGFSSRAWVITNPDGSYDICLAQAVIGQHAVGIKVIFFDANWNVITVELPITVTNNLSDYSDLQLTIINNGITPPRVKAIGTSPSSIVWYWQINDSNGTDTSKNSSQDLQIPNPAQTTFISLRAYDVNLDSWSDQVKSIYYYPGVVPVTPPSETLSSNEHYIYTVNYNKASQELNLESLAANDKIRSVSYFDNFMRPSQKTLLNAGGNNEDIVTPIHYNDYGKQEKHYLPLPETNNNGKFVNNAEYRTNVFYQSKNPEDFSGMNTAQINPFSETQFEDSPLERVLKVGAPGKDWQLNRNANTDHTVKFQYSSNLSNEVKLFTVSLNYLNGLYEPTLVNVGYYDANQLYKTVTYDENATGILTESNGSTVEFKNKEGQVILKRKYSTVGTAATNEKYDTYYVYDVYGNLTYVIPPKAVDLISNTTTVQANITSTAVTTAGNSLHLKASQSITLLPGFHAQQGSTFSAVIVSDNQTVLDNLCYQYKHDQKNRMVEKKLPGKQWEYIVYDKLDRVVATGPALSPFNDTAVNATGWLITKYDVFSRPVYTGWEPSSTINSQGRILKQNTLNSASIFNEKRQASATIDGITVYYTNTVSPTSFKLLTVNYYDDYSFPNVPVVPAVIESQTVLNGTEVKGLPTGSWTRIPTSVSVAQADITTTFYDKKSRPVRLYNKNYLGGYTYCDSKLDFTGKPEYTITFHKRDNLGTSTELKTKETFTYSPQGKLLKQTHQINDGVVELIADNRYDELGQLVTKEVGGKIQKIDYTYNIRGWLKGINNTNGLQQGTDPKDLFAFKINYNAPDSGISGITPLYNGNITETQWATNSDNGLIRTYGYKYDKMDRLREGIYKKGTLLNTYNESMDYDLNGNIMHLKRRGSLDDNTSLVIDDLTYDYKNNNLSNQLSKVTDAVANNSNFKYEFKDSATNTNDDFEYDADGNMTLDNNKNIISIRYNHLNLPTRITFASTGNIEYIYDAVGQKVKKISNEAGNTTTTDYLSGYQYTTTPQGSTALKFFPTTEGYVEKQASSYKYIYQYKDHLGNVRLSYDKNLVIQEENNYYPFGLKQTGYNSVVIASNYKYKYNGKELQDELGLNFYDYGARNYQPDLGIWRVIDPLAEKSRRFSPYTYALNNPVFFIDPDGMEATDWFKGAGGRIVWFDSQSKGFTDTSGGKWTNVGATTEQVQQNMNIPKTDIIKYNSVDAFGSSGTNGAGKTGVAINLVTFNNTAQLGFSLNVENTGVGGKLISGKSEITGVNIDARFSTETWAPGLQVDGVSGSFGVKVNSPMGEKFTAESSPFKDIGTPMLSNAPFHATSEASLTVPLISYSRLTNSSSGAPTGLNLKFNTSAQTTTSNGKGDEIIFNLSN